LELSSFEEEFEEFEEFEEGWFEVFVIPCLKMRAKESNRSERSAIVGGGPTQANYEKRDVYCGHISKGCNEHTEIIRKYVRSAEDRRT